MVFMKLYKHTLGVYALLLVAVAALFAAIAHTSCIFRGVSCYREQMAAEFMVQSAIEGTWVAPVATLIISALFVLAAVYALSAAKIIKSMPFLKMDVYSFTSLCLIRGLASIPLLLAFPDKLSFFSILAGIIWFSSGVLLLQGYRLVNDPRHSHPRLIE